MLIALSTMIHTKFIDYLNNLYIIFQGPKGETIGAIVQPMPYSSLIFRAPSEAAGISSSEVKASFSEILYMC